MAIINDMKTPLFKSHYYRIQTRKSHSSIGTTKYKIVITEYVDRLNSSHTNAGYAISSTWHLSGVAAYYEAAAMFCLDINAFLEDCWNRGSFTEWDDTSSNPTFYTAEPKETKPNPLPPHEFDALTPFRGEKADDFLRRMRARDWRNKCGEIVAKSLLPKLSRWVRYSSKNRNAQLASGLSIWNTGSGQLSFSNQGGLNTP